MGKEIRIKTVARDDGLFRFESEAEFREDGEIYWGPSGSSGLYGTPEEAEATALHEVDWLKFLK